MKHSSLIKIFSILLFIFVFACTENNNDISNFNNGIKKNIYKDNEVLQTINTYQQNADVENLIKYLNDKNPNYQIHSLYALASLKDTNALYSVLGLLSDENPQVRRVAAYTLGCFENPEAEQKLLEVYNTEQEDIVKETVLVALGKCGTEISLNYVVSLKIKNDNKQLLESQAKAFYYLAQKGYISQQMIDKVGYILNNQMVAEGVKQQFSYFLTLDNIEISDFYSIIKYELENRKNIFLLSNLAIGLGQIHSTESLNLLKNIIRAETDYRVKISAIKALENFNYYSTNDVIFEALQSDNPSLVIAASEYILAKGNSADVQKYLNFSEKINSIQARSNLYRAALYYAVAKKPITDKIISGYNVSNNIYEKAGLLYALSADPRTYKFVKKETFSNSHNIISSEGIKSLYLMRVHKDFDKIARTIKQNSGDDLYLEFIIIFKEAMTSNDNAKVYYASKIMNLPKMNFFDQFTNTFYLNQAINMLALPRDLTTYKALCKTINTFGTHDCPTNYTIPEVKPDWDNITKIPGNQKVLVETSKGEFEILLDVNSAPIEVSEFLTMVKDNQYNDIFITKNIPNSAIVTGGKRGDGWMNKNISIISEFKNKKIQEGSVAMMIISDEYLSTNWFVATSESIKLTDKYSVFGQVVSGMNIVHQLEVGDVIHKVKIL